MLGEGVANVEGGGGGWRKRFNYRRESEMLVSSDMLMAREYARLSESEAAAVLEEKEQDLILAAELGKSLFIQQAKLNWVPSSSCCGSISLIMKDSPHFNTDQCQNVTISISLTQANLCWRGTRSWRGGTEQLLSSANKNWRWDFCFGLVWIGLGEFRTTKICW